METLEQRFISRVSAFLGRTGLWPTTLADPNPMRQIGDRALVMEDSR